MTQVRQGCKRLSGAGGRSWRYETLVSFFNPVLEVFGLDSIFTMSCRQNTSLREGHLERESEKYRNW